MNLAAPIAEPIEIEVKYSMCDYFAAVASHAPQVFLDRGDKTPAWLVKFIVPPIACMAAITSKKLKPVYRFTFSNVGVVRRADGREMATAWSDILRVRTYATAFFIEIEKGAMVVPFRFLTEEQQTVLRRSFGATSR